MEFTVMIAMLEKVTIEIESTGLDHQPLLATISLQPNYIGGDLYLPDNWMPWTYRAAKKELSALDLQIVSVDEFHAHRKGVTHPQVRPI